MLASQHREDPRSGGGLDGEADSGKVASGDGLGVAGYAGLGALVLCCAVIEVLGGAIVLGGLATLLGLSTGMTYLAVVGLSGLLVALGVLAYRRLR